MSNKLFITITVVLLVAITGALSYNYLKDMPQVSADDSKIMLEEYKENLISLFDQLNSEYDKVKTDKDMAVWEQFSAQWMPGLLNARPDGLQKRIPKGLESKKEVMIFIQQDMLSLWEAYNTEISGNGKSSKETAELKRRIESVLRSVEF